MLPSRARPLWAILAAVTLTGGVVVVGAGTAAGEHRSAPAGFPARAAEHPVRVEPVAVRLVRAGEVAPEDNPGVLSALARAEREPLAAPEPERSTAGATGTSGRDGDASGADAAPPTDPAAETVEALEQDVRAHAAQVLASLPGGERVEIAWDHPDIGNHLGGVRLDDPTVMMLNSRRFEAEPHRVAATVKHEVGHFYQGAVIAARAEAAGGWWNAYWELDAVLGSAFGSAWMERSADCVALHLGADWTNYTSECSAPGQQDAVEALVALRFPG